MTYLAYSFRLAYTYHHSWLVPSPSGLRHSEVRNTYYAVTENESDLSKMLFSVGKYFSLLLHLTSNIKIFHLSIIQT